MQTNIKKKGQSALLCLLACTYLSGMTFSSKTSYAALGLKNAIMSASEQYDNHPGMWCAIDVFQGMEDANLPSEAKTRCTAAIAGIASAVALIGGFTLGVGAAVAYAGIIGSIIGAAEGAQATSSLCHNGLHPGPWADEDIINILKSQGGKYSAADVADKYDKICFEFHGKKTWLKKDECTEVDGFQFCAVAEDFADDFLCVYITSTCPCIGTVGAGSLVTPYYEKDSEGDVITDERGNPTIKNESSFNTYFARHCNLITSNISTQLLPFEYTGIIDELCNGWRGYSKVKFPFTSGPVQCLQGTMQNIFEKPVSFKNVDGTVEVSDQQKPKLESMQKDKQMIVETFNKVKDLVSKTNLDSNPDFSLVIQKIKDIQSGAAFLSEYKNDYGYPTLNTNIDTTGNTNIDTIYRSYLNSILPSLEEIARRVGARMDSFLESIRSVVADEDSTTIFQNFQGVVKILAFFAIILYITLLGMQVVLGSIDITLKEIVKIAYRVGLIYYFALGDAWKEYFYRMIFDATIGVSEILFDATSGASEVHTQDCLFTKKYYSAKQGDICNYPNPQMKDPLVAFKVAEDKTTGAPLYGCLKGPFIFQPNYARPYRPSSYFTVDALGTQTERTIQMYCVNPDGQTLPANKIMNDVTNRPKQWSCNFGYTLEEGIRISEYKKIGLTKLTEYYPYLSDDDIIKTALVAVSPEGIQTEIFPKRPRSIQEGKEKVARFKEAEVIETLRSNVNQSYRLYPQIEKYGTKRDYSYVGLFDMMDCKLIKYMQYTADGFSFINVFDIFSFVFGGVMVIVILFLMLFYLFFVIGLAGKVVQSYLVGIIAITVLVYFSPIIMPLMLFSATKGIGADWVKKISGYASYPAILFTTLGLSLCIFDYTFYGSAEKFIEQHMFKDDGGVDGKNCWQDDPWGAPTACLLSKLPYMKTKINILFISFSVVDVSSDAFLALMVALLRTIIMILILNKLVAQFENDMKNLFGITADTSLEGSIFNDAGGLQNMVKDLAQKAQAGIKAGMASRSKGAGGKAGSGTNGSKDGPGDNEGDSPGNTEEEDNNSDETQSEEESYEEESEEEEEGPTEDTNDSGTGPQTSSEGTITRDIAKTTTPTDAVTSYLFNKEKSGGETANQKTKSENLLAETKTESLSDNKNSSTTQIQRTSIETSKVEKSENKDSSKTTSPSSTSFNEANTTSTITDNTTTSTRPTNTDKTPTGTNEASRNQGQKQTTTLENDNYVSSKGLSGDVIQDLNNRKKSDDSKRTPRKMFNQGADYSNVKSKIGSTNYGFKPQRPGVKRVQHQRADYSNVKSRLFDYEKKGGGKS